MEVDAMTMRTRWPRLTKGTNAGSLCCAECEGDGRIEYADGHPDDPDAPSSYEPCERCRGTGAEPCAAHGCKAPAHIIGADGRLGYCTVEHAHADGNWPACVRCHERAQGETFAPWCSSYCHEQTAADVARVAARLPRAA